MIVERTVARPRNALTSLAWLAVAGALASCDGSTDMPVDTSFWPLELSTWGLFVGDGHAQEPVAGVIPYRPVSPLFSDYAAKHRFLRLPAGTQIAYQDLDSWGYPADTVLVKTFGYARDARDPAAGELLLETRLLWLRADGWQAMTYIWNDAQTEATRAVAGKTTRVPWIDATGTARDTSYRIPNTNQCRTCHAGEDELEPLGPRTRQLDTDDDYGSGPENQIDHLATLGLFDRAPPPRAMREAMVDPFTTDAAVSTETRARAYLEANCAHCHRAGGRASSSGLYLGWAETDPARLGVCKTPPAAGRGSCGLMFDVVPGDPASSILICRVSSTDPEIRMPEIPNSLVHDEGVALLTQWIAEMPPVDCSAR